MKAKKLNNLEKLIARSDYEKLSLRLAKKCEELADIIIDKMIKLQIDEISNLRLKTVSVDDFVEVYLVIDSFYFEDSMHKTSGALNFNFRSRGRKKSRIYISNFTTIRTSNDKEALYFLDNFNKYLNEIKEIETKKSEKIKEALKQVNNL